MRPYCSGKDFRSVPDPQPWDLHQAMGPAPRGPRPHSGGRQPPPQQMPRRLHGAHGSVCHRGTAAGPRRRGGGSARTAAHRERRGPISAVVTPPPRGCDRDTKNRGSSSSGFLNANLTAGPWAVSWGRCWPPTGAGASPQPPGTTGQLGVAGARRRVGDGTACALVSRGGAGGTPHRTEAASALRGNLLEL